MKITLKKGHQVQQELIKIIDSIDLKTTTQISEFADAEKLLLSADNDLLINFCNKEKLYNALYFIRDNINKLNNGKSGLNDKVSEVAKISRIIKDLEELTDSKPMESIDVIKKRQDQLIVQKSSGSFSTFGLVVSCVSEKTLKILNESLLKYKRIRNDLKDEITNLNLQLSFQLSEEVADVLIQEGLVNLK